MKRKIRMYAFNLAIGIMIATPICILASGSQSKIESIESESFIETVNVSLPINKEPVYVTKESTVAETETETKGFEPYKAIPLGEKLQLQIKSLCDKYQADYNLCLAIIKTESEFQVDIIGDNGQAIGLCQIWPKWWSGLASEKGLNIYEPKDNVELMLIILTSHLKECDGDLTKALQKYNSGSTDGTEYADRVHENLVWINKNAP